MNKWLKERLKTIISDLLDIALDNKAATIAFLSPLFATGMVYLALIYQTTRGILISEVTKEPALILVWHIIAFVVLLLSGIGLGLIIPKLSKEKDYLFINGINVKWKTSSDFANVEKNPYCKKHQIKLLLFNDGYRCPDCYDSIVENDSVLEIDHRVAQHKAEAIINKHYRGRV